MNLTAILALVAALPMLLRHLAAIGGALVLVGTGITAISNNDFAGGWHQIILGITALGLGVQNVAFESPTTPAATPASGS